MTGKLIAVTLCVRVWIEIVSYDYRSGEDIRHPLREGVD